ncbi:MAG: hypothetical protein ACYC1U_11345 [Candidatus Aquicultorales bacterium]
MRKRMEAAESRLYDVMDANANGQDIYDNVVELYKGVLERQRIDQDEGVLWNLLWDRIAEMFYEAHTDNIVGVEVAFDHILDVRRALERLEKREDERDRKDYALFAVIERAAVNVVALMQRAASWLESVLAAHKKPRTTKAG